MALSRSPRNSADGLATSVSPLPGHLEDADLVGRAEAVLHRAQDAELMAALAFEIEHRIDQMLDRLGPGDLAVLGDVADQDHAPRRTPWHSAPDRTTRCAPGRWCRAPLPARWSRWSGWNRWRRRRASCPFPAWTRMSSMQVAEPSATGASESSMRPARRRTCAIASSPEI